MVSLQISRSQLVLRAIVLLGPVCAVLVTGPAGHWPPWWVLVVVAALSGGFAALPESPVGSGAFLAVLCWWAAGLDDGLHPTVLVAAALLALAQVAAVLASYGPAEMPVDPALVRIWVARWLLLVVPVPAVWALALLLRDEPEQPGVWVVGVAAGLVATVVAGVALTRDSDPGGAA